MDTNAFIRHYTKKILLESRTKKPLGGISKASREVLGLADTNPKELLRRLGISSTEKVNIEKILNSFVSNDDVSSAFENVNAYPAGVYEVYIKIFNVDKENISLSQKAAVSPHQAWRYVKAAINAASKVGVIDINPDKISYQIFEEDEEKLLVRVTT